MSKESFEWDTEKDLVNQTKHGVSFADAQHAFVDPNRVIAQDLSHSHREKRYYCFGKVGDGIMTVRFRAGGKITSGFRIPSSRHLRPLLNRESSPYAPIRGLNMDEQDFSFLSLSCLSC